MSMIKFSVVHAPLSPLEGPGLECPDQSVQDAMDIRIEDYPYGPAGQSSIGNSGPKLSSDKNRKKKKRIVAGIDFDGTITVDPRAFKCIIDNVMKAGGECHLITGRPNIEAAQVKDYCKMYGLKFSSMNFYPINYVFTRIDRDPSIDFKVAAWKADVLTKLSADVMVDDSYVYSSVIAKRLPEILILKPKLVGL